MDKKNHDHVAIDPDRGAHWEFLVESDATTCTPMTADVIDTVQKLMQAFGEFVKPTALTYGIGIYEDEQQPLPFGDVSSDVVDTVERQLHDKSGITPEAFVSSTEIPHAGARWISRVPFHSNRVKIRLSSGDYYVDRTNRCVEYDHGKPVDKKPLWDPIKIDVTNRPNRTKVIESEFTIGVSVGIRSQIWLEETDVGRINREYLAAFLSRVDENLSADLIKRDNEWHTSIDLSTIY